MTCPATLHVVLSESALDQLGELALSDGWRRVLVAMDRSPEGAAGRQVADLLRGRASLPASLPRWPS